MKLNLIKFTALLVAFISVNAHALPIDWHGIFGVDTTLIDNYRFIEQRTQATDSAAAGGRGSQEIDLAAGDQANASFQTYVFRLNPEIIINDTASFYGEITSGYGRGGRLGDNSGRKSNESNEPFGNSLYYYNTNDPAQGNSGLNLNQFYIELYSDTATYKIGRFSNHWGLGALVHNGENPWDRHLFVRDGVELQFKIGNFNIRPYWAKISNEDTLTRATKAKEWGFSLLYDNPVKDMAFGVLYGKKEDKTSSTFTQVDTDGDGTDTPLTKTDIKITDIFLRKQWGDFTAALEIALLTGNLGDVYENNSETKYKAKAFILETDYKLNNSWTFKGLAGKVTGDSGQDSSFEAMYLNPNYQIANLLFRYNMAAVSNPNQDFIFDSYITNTTYVKLMAEYIAGNWDWRFSAIYAIAEEAAVNGQQAYNHTTNKVFAAVANQGEDMGTEIDIDVTYRWNKEVNVEAGFGYLMVGDYYSFTNEADRSNTADSAMSFQLKTSVEF
jgi:hypothetical protein